MSSTHRDWKHPDEVVCSTASCNRGAKAMVVKIVDGSVEDESPRCADCSERLVEDGYVEMPIEAYYPYDEPAQEAPYGEDDRQEGLMLYDDSGTESWIEGELSDDGAGCVNVHDHV